MKFNTISFQSNFFVNFSAFQNQSELYYFTIARKSGNILFTYWKYCFRLMTVGRKQYFQYVKRMFPLFRAIVKFCSTNRLFNFIIVKWLTYERNFGSVFESAYFSCLDWKFLLANRRDYFLPLFFFGFYYPMLDPFNIVNRIVLLFYLFIIVALGFVSISMFPMASCCTDYLIIVRILIM